MIGVETISERKTIMGNEEKENCMTCRFYWGAACCRHSPTRHHVPSRRVFGFPSVPVDGWCGDYEKENDNGS